MSHMFEGAESFNQPINNWDVGNVTNMSHMFEYAIVFNQPIGNWDVGNVTNMSDMFSDARSFNQPIGNWNVSNVTNMTSMFYAAKNFNQPIGEWIVSNVTNMGFIFSIAEAFNQPIGDWDVSRVTNMIEMFYDAKEFNQPIGNWDVSNVTNMEGMFKFAISFNQSIGDWDVSRVTNMKEMFYDAKKFNQPIGKWIVSNVTNMEGMFEGAVSFNQPIGNWDVSRVTNMVYMFEGAVSFNQPIDNWNYQENAAAARGPASYSDTNSYVNASDASRYTGSNTDWEYNYDIQNQINNNRDEAQRNEYQRNDNRDENKKNELVRINRKIAEMFLKDNLDSDYHLLEKLKNNIANGRDVSSFLNVLEVNYDTNNTHDTNGNRNYFINDIHLFELNGLRQTSNFALGLITEYKLEEEDEDEDDEHFLDLFYLINPATKKIPHTDAEHILIHDLSKKSEVLDSLEVSNDFYFNSNNELSRMKYTHPLLYYSYDNRYPFVILGSYYNQEEKVIEYLTTDAHNLYFACKKTETDEEWRDYYNENIVKKIIEVESDKEGKLRSIEPTDPIQRFHYIKIKYDEKYDENNKKVYKLYDIDITSKHKTFVDTRNYRILDGQLGMITLAENRPQSGETATYVFRNRNNINVNSNNESYRENSNNENNLSYISQENSNDNNLDLSNTEPNNNNNRQYGGKKNKNKRKRNTKKKNKNKKLRKRNTKRKTKQK
jgi:surface protein